MMERQEEMRKDGKGGARGGGPPVGVNAKG